MVQFESASKPEEDGIPRRREKYLNSGKERSRYCSKHRRYYRSDVGCELCVYEESNLGRIGGNIERLQRCPECGEMSLLWLQCSNRCECLNLNCKLKFAENEL